MRTLLVALFIGVPWGTPILFAQTNPDAVLRRVDDHYNHLSSLRSRFIEHYTGMGIDRTETGTVLLKKPGCMKWTYDRPAGKVFISDGKYGWSYSPGDTQATRIAAKKLDDLRSPLRLLLGHTELKKELDNVSMAPDGADLRISGVPKGMSLRIRLLSLEVTSSGAILIMRIEEADGSVTEFTFPETQNNVPVRESDFIFVPPAGVEVVDGLPPV